MRLSIVNGDRIANRRRIYKIYTVIYPPPGQSTTPTTQNQSNICESQPFSSTILNVNRTIYSTPCIVEIVELKRERKKYRRKNWTPFTYKFSASKRHYFTEERQKKCIYMINTTQHAEAKRNETKRRKKKLMNIFTLIWPSSRSFPQTRSIWHWTCFFPFMLVFIRSNQHTHTHEHVIYVGAFLFTNEKKVIAVSNRYEMKSTHYAFKIDLVCFRIVSLCRSKKVSNWIHDIFQILQ